jgi:hypothetical protein
MPPSRARLMLVVLALGACGDGRTGPPIPDPLPLVNGLRASGYTEGVEASHLLLALPGTVAAAGQVRVTTSVGTYSTSSVTEGSFVLAIEALGGETVAVRFRESEPALFTLTPSCRPPGSCKESPAPVSLPGVEPITAPDSGGISTVRGLTAANVAVIAANASSGSTGGAVADPSGAFALKIVAQSGQEVRVFRDGAPLGAPWVLLAP